MLKDLIYKITTWPVPLRPQDVRTGFFLVTAMALIPFDKPYKTTEELIALLESRGMSIADRKSAALYLKRIGYYRLSGYWYPFRVTTLGAKSGKRIAADTFKSGTEFRHAVKLYIFDKYLRLLFLDAIESIEVSLRVEIVQLLGPRNPLAHLDPTELHGNFANKISRWTHKTEYADWKEQLIKVIERSKEDFVQHFKDKYNTGLPIWIAIELWEFGMLSKFLNGMQVSDQDAIMQIYKVPRRELLLSWIRGINYVRNLCAHHCRLWNRSMVDQPKPPRPGECEALNHLAQDSFSQGRLYSVAAPIQFLLKAIDPASKWKEHLKSHFATFPSAPGIAQRDTGFPDGWENMSLWK